MKDEKIKAKEKELINLVSGFCDAELDEEYKDLSIKLVEKLGRKHEVPFKRGKLENWASGIIYALGQINFLFDDSFDPYATPDDICGFFKTKKSTASNKARDIRRMLNLKPFDKEFSTSYVKSSPAFSLGFKGRGDFSQMKSLNGSSNMAMLQATGDILRLMSRRR